MPHFHALPVCGVLLLTSCGIANRGNPAGFPEIARTVSARSGRATSNAPQNPSNRDNIWVPAGESRTILDVSGSGVIRHIWLTFAESGPSWLSKDGAAAPDEVVIRAYWDGSATPSVEAPLGDFFAAGFGKRAEVNSAMVQVQGGDAYNCYWPMPFRKSAKITITNESARPFAAFYYNINYSLQEVPEDFAYFCARYRREFPTRLGGDYKIAEITGQGHYVGTVFSVRTRSPEWFGEGDEKFYIDGETTPSIQGTGTEDYFLNAWGLEKCNFPYFGVPILEGDWGEVGARMCAYRWHIPDPVYFSKSLRLEIEHYGWMSADETKSGKVEGFVEREDDFATVAFWYQKGQPFVFETLPPLAERRFPNLDLIVEGRELLNGAAARGGTMNLQKGASWTGDGQVFLDAPTADASFTLKFNVEKQERRRLVIPITHSFDFGIYQILLDGEPLGDPIDFYNSSVDVREHFFSDRALASGDHTIAFVCKGKNTASKGYKLGVDSVRLRERSGRKR